MRTFAISDIHGCSRTFETLLEKIGLDKTDELYLLGDYIDRGPDSKAVIDLIFKLKAEDYKVHCLMGNHEIMMLHAISRPLSLEAIRWKSWNGGDATLQSFGVKKVAKLEDHYVDWIQSLPYFIERDRFIFVHAGLNFEIQDPLSDRQSMLWSFDDRPKVNKAWLGNRVVVHGHRIHNRMQIRQNIIELDEFPVLGIDNGCVYSRKGFNKLCAVELNSMDLTFQKNIDIDV